jgi:hypothetical protein
VEQLDGFGEPVIAVVLRGERVEVLADAEGATGAGQHESAHLRPVAEMAHDLRNSIRIAVDRALSCFGRSIRITATSRTHSTTRRPVGESQMTSFTRTPLSR